MRQLLFKNYLKEYIKDLSGHNTLSIHELVKAYKRNYRLFDSLVLYCALNGKKDLFNKYTKNQYADLLLSLNENNFLDNKYRDYDFSKIWDSYQHRINIVSYDKDTKKKIRSNIIKLMNEKNITNYRVYKDLELNPGNINDYLTNGNVDKVSLDLVKRIYNYVNKHE